MPEELVLNVMCVAQTGRQTDSQRDARRDGCVCVCVCLEMIDQVVGGSHLPDADLSGIPAILIM